MANACRIAAAAAVAAANAVVDLIDAGAAAGAIVLYIGSVPAYCDDAHGTEVATCTCADPAYAAAAADAVNKWADANLASTATDSSATGNASPVTYFRAEDSDGNPVFQGNVSTSGADLNLNSTTIGTGAQVDIIVLEYEVPYNQA